MASRTGLLDIAMPRLSDSMEEATVLRWLKQPGDRVEKGEPLVEVETDKATIVYEAEATGVLEDLVVDEGATAALGAVIARLRPEGDAAPSGRGETSGRARATPIARRLARKLDVRLEGVRGSGPRGRIVGADVRTAAAGAQPAQAAGDGAGRPPATEIPLTPTQRTIAQRMTESRASVPDFTLEVEVPMDAAARLRADLESWGREPVPSYNDLVVRAAALALRDFAALNASYAAGKVLRHGRINVGVAVDAGDALLVPTIRDADQKSVFEIAAESRVLAERVRARTVAPDELAEGTFTVSNLGMFGVRRFHAVINQPQAAILAVGEVAPRAVADVEGVVRAQLTMEVALSCDHRVVYGAEAARFLQRFRQLLEHPLALVID